MQRARTLGALATCLAILGYLVGVLVPYPGRSFSLALGMVGITLVAIGGDDA